jgi:hypothetical protein
MGRKWNEKLDGKRWLDRAEVMLSLAETAHEETRAHMEQLAANWRFLAALEDERQRSACAETGSVD